MNLRFLDVLAQGPQSPGYYVHNPGLLDKPEELSGALNLLLVVSGGVGRVRLLNFFDLLAEQLFVGLVVGLVQVSEDGDRSVEGGVVLDQAEAEHRHRGEVAAAELLNATEGLSAVLDYLHICRV